MSHSVKDMDAIKQAIAHMKKMKTKGAMKLAKRLAKIKDPRKARTSQQYSQKSEKTYEGNPNE